ncbi:MAG: GIY-YIG nuclease family protein [Roseiarcus sp.]
MSIEFRQRALSSLTDDIGVYALCDLDQVPVYVGQSVDGIRSRVRRHLTSARSDIIANRQVDVWEIAYVWAWPTTREVIPLLEARLFHEFDAQKTLMNGTIPARPGSHSSVPEKQIVQVMDTTEIEGRLDPVLRLPRQIEHYGRLVDHVLVVKDSSQLRRSLRAHFERLQRYHASFLKQSGPEVVGSED